jgi:glycosyltransferase involved in cell wall biosynthesis
MEAMFIGHAMTNGCRTTYFFPGLAREGIRARYVDVPNGPSRMSLLKTLPSCDVVLVQRLALGDEEVALLRTKAPRLVYDVDDPIMYRSSRHWLRFSLARRRAFRSMAGAADAFLASSSLIAREALRILPADRVFVVPSTVDGEVYCPGPPRAPGPVVLGWLGSAGTAKYLARLRGVLRAVCRKVPELRIRVVSNKFPGLEGLALERKIWKREDEVLDLQSFDVGLLPLSDDLWTRGKGHGKLFQYLATGLPVVGSPVGIVGETLQDGVTGFLPRRASEWTARLLQLARDPELRGRLGRQARADFEARHSLQAVFPVFLKALTG